MNTNMYRVGGLSTVLSAWSMSNARSKIHLDDLIDEYNEWTDGL